MSGTSSSSSSNSTSGTANSNGSKGKVTTTQVHVQPRDGDDDDLIVREEAGCCTLRLRQTKILLYKNALLMKRSLRNTVIQVVVPLAFILLLLILGYGVEANERRSGGIAALRETPEVTVAPIQPCSPGEGQDTCTTLAYYAPDSFTQAVVDDIIATDGIESHQGFESTDAINEYLAANPNSTQHAILFECASSCAYEVTSNVTVCLSPGACTTTSTPWVPASKQSVCFGESLACTGPPQVNTCNGLFFPCSNTSSVFRNVSFSNATDDLAYTYAIQYNRTQQITVWDENINLQTTVVLPLKVAADRAILRQVTGDSEAVLNIRTTIFPRPELITFDVVAAFGPVFFFAALMFNFVIQMGQIVAERELHLREAMEQMGLRTSAYWASWFVTNIVINSLSAIVLLLGGFIFRFDFFVKNNFTLLVIFFLLFNWAMVPFTFLLSVPVTKSRTATSLGFAMFLIGTIVQGFASFLFTEDFAYPWIATLLKFIPFSILGFGIGHISDYSSSEDSVGMAWADRGEGFFSLVDCFVWLIVDFFVLFVVALYLDNVVPNEHGVSKPLWYFLLPSYWSPERSAKGRAAIEPVANDGELASESATQLAPHEVGINVDHLRKVYQSKICCIARSPFTAVAGINVAVPKDSIFCLLGHNGAGKSTTIGMLTGLFGSTTGTAQIYGYDIKTDMTAIRRIMGVCPQHDILWNQLTGEEHIRIFASLKGVPAGEVEKEVTARLEDVGLTYVGKLVSSAYSGGMRRRLSTAISLTASPKIVFLDEPTTGMDPVSRRQVWDLIERVKKDKVIVLTTHSMEEADVLGDRIAVMSAGKIVAADTSLGLKNRYGVGYVVSIVLREGANPDGAIEFLRELLGQAGIESDAAEENGSVYASIPTEAADLIPEIVNAFEDRKARLNAADLQVNMTTLESVFIRINEEAHAAEAAAASHQLARIRNL